MSVKCGELSKITKNIVVVGVKKLGYYSVGASGGTTADFPNVGTEENPEYHIYCAKSVAAPYVIVYAENTEEFPLWWPTQPEQKPEPRYVEQTLF